MPHCGDNQKNLRQLLSPRMHRKCTLLGGGCLADVATVLSLKIKPESSDQLKETQENI